MNQQIQEIEASPKVYIQTREECAKHIHGVCDSCGGELEPVETVDNAGSPTFWSACLKCGTFQYGTDPDIFKIAVELVDNHNWVVYSHAPLNAYRFGTDSEKDYWRRSQISGTVSKIRDVLQVQKQLDLSLLRQGQRWIDIEERIPNKGQPIAALYDGICYVGHYHFGGYDGLCQTYPRHCLVVHGRTYSVRIKNWWLALPELPQQGL